MKIFLTGGSGFIGSHFINQAHEAGHEIIAIKRKNSQPRVPLNKEPKWVVCSLDEDARSFMDGSDVFVHLATHSASHPYDDLENCLYWNVYASIKLADQAKDVGINKFLITGTCYEYGLSAKDYKFIPVTASLQPTSPYPISKASASIAFMGFAIERQIQLRILRVFQVYGEGDHPSRLWQSLREAALKGKDFPMTLSEQIRDFIDVKEVAKKIVEGLNFDNIKNGLPLTENIGSGTEQSLKDFASYWWKYWQATGEIKFGSIPYRENEIMRLVPDLKI